MWALFPRVKIIHSSLLDELEMEIFVSGSKINEIPVP